MKELIQFFKDRFGYRYGSTPPPQEIGLPVIYKGERYLLLPFVAVPTIHEYCSRDNYTYRKDRYSIHGTSDFDANDLYYDFAYINAKNNNQQELRIIDIPKICTVKPTERCGHLNYNLFFKEINLVWCLGYYDDNASGTFSFSRKEFWEFCLFCACEKKEPTKQKIQEAIFWVVKNAYDSKQNPYFNFAGNHFDMPEAIIYMLDVAKKQITDCGDAMGWANARIAETVDVPYEEDENINPVTARAHGFEQKQLVYMKAAHEYYLTHVHRKSFFVLQRTRFDVDRIFSLAQRIPPSYWQTCSFDEAHRKGIEDAVSLLD